MNLTCLLRIIFKAARSSQSAGNPIAATSTLEYNFNDYNISVNEI